MKRVTTALLILAFISIPLFSGCQSKQLQEENAALKSQMDSLNAARATLDSKVKELTTENSALKSQVEGLTKEREDMSAKVADLEKQLSEAKTAKGKKK